MQYHIAVTDDDDINLKAAELILSFNGYKVSCFKSGEELLQFLVDQTPDLILLDLHMTGIDGFETMRRINSMEVGSKVPVIFSVLTVLNQQQALDRCGGKLGNKGVEGAYTAIKMANLV